eukprot:343077-Rhodomonas_salina.1
MVLGLSAEYGARDWGVGCYRVGQVLSNSGSEFYAWYELHDQYLVSAYRILSSGLAQQHTCSSSVARCRSVCASTRRTVQHQRVQYWLGHVYQMPVPAYSVAQYQPTPLY